MSKDPRDGLKLRLGYEVAREIERTPVISLGVQDAATKAINSVLYQRLQDQIFDNLVWVYRIAAGGSPSIDPKFPCPSIKGKLIEKS